MADEAKAEEKSGGIRIDSGSIIQAVLIAALVGGCSWFAAEMIGNKSTLVRIEDKAESATRDIGRVEKAVGEMREDLRGLGQRVYDRSTAERDQRATDVRLQRLEDKAAR